MDCLTVIKKYLKSLQDKYNNASTSGQYTKELSYRQPIQILLEDLAKILNPSESDDIDIILEPSSQGEVGRPDWRIHNKKTLGIYGYIEGKGPRPEIFDITPHKTQIEKYKTLGHKLIITDGIDFIFCLNNKQQQPITISIFSKTRFASRDWSSEEINPKFEFYMRDFFQNPSPEELSEEKLVELVAIRTRILADEILQKASIPLDEAVSTEEKKAIEKLDAINNLVYSHNDNTLRTPQVFSDFTAQVIMFCLLFAHRVLCKSTDTPIEKEIKIKKYVEDNLAWEESLLPFRSLTQYIASNSDSGFFIRQWVDECVKFLSFVKMTDWQLENPDYHELFEKFLTQFDSKSRFDYGAYYTPKILADFVVKLTNRIAEEKFDKASIYDDGNTIIDPCCGTGSFIEEIINHDLKNGAFKVYGIEILPAPYMLANYRLSLLDKQHLNRKYTHEIFLANTLNDYVIKGNADNNTIEGKELNRAKEVASLPIMLIIGNPPCSDTNRGNNNFNNSIIRQLMDDFRPPEDRRHGRQNIQKQIENPFMMFLRWSCKKLLDEKQNAILSMVVPLAFLEAESYRYARKYITENFSDVWTIAIDADARTGTRNDSLFHTLQGRAVIILSKKGQDDKCVTNYHFYDCSVKNKREKEEFLNAPIEEIVSKFSLHEIDTRNYSFLPIKSFDINKYNSFWPISGEKDVESIFINHCSGTKLAPTSIFTHIKTGILKRRSREIAQTGYEGTKTWFDKQDRPPEASKVEALRKALNDCDSTGKMEETITSNIKPYSFRPFLNSNVLLWKDVLQKYAKIGGGGTRLRPEIINAYDSPKTLGFAMAHAPKDLNPTLSQFVSFCWYYPDNDMCARGNSHIYLNQYYNKHKKVMEMNINPQLIDKLILLLKEDVKSVADDAIYYSYAILCSQKYLDEFEGALFTVNQSDQRARIPIVNETLTFKLITKFGKDLAELEKNEYQPENILGFDYKGLAEQVPDDFHLSNSNHLFNEVEEQLILTDGYKKIPVKCPLSIQKLNISGYDVIKQVWLKFNSYDFTHCSFEKDDMNKLLDLLNKLAIREKYVANLDLIVADILSGKIELISSN